MIKIQNVSRIYPHKKTSVSALDKVSLTLPNTGFIALCGENGCGKSTLLNILATVDEDYEGEVYVNNLNIRSHKEYIRSKLVSYVFQENFFISNLTVSENLRIETSDLNFADYQLQLYEIEDKRDTYTYSLSGGQKQRLSFIRGMLKAYEILLVDEPTSSMDEDTEKKVFETLKTVSKQKLVVLVSHNLAMIQAYTDIIIKMNNGKIEYIRQNDSGLDLKREENTYIFPNKINFKAIDESETEKIIREYGCLKIKVDSTLTAPKQFDYTVKSYTPLKTEHADINKKKLFLKNILKENFFITLTFALLWSIVLVVLECMMDFNHFDNEKFIYETIHGNKEDFVNMYQGAYTFEEDKLSLEDIAFMEENYPTRIELVRDMKNMPCFEFTNSFYENKLTTLNLSNFKNVIFLAGQSPEDYSTFAITDYVADALILGNEDYSSYTDILNKGIFINGYQIKISGIMDTEYEQYKNVGKELGKRDSTNFLQEVMTSYCSLYGTRKSVTISNMGFIYISTGEFYSDFLLIDEEMAHDSCDVNSAFAERIGYDGSENFYFKYINGYLSIRSVVEDGKENPSVYVNGEIMEGLIYGYRCSFDSINIEIIGRDISDFLYAKNMIYNSYSGTYVYKTIRMISIIKNIFLALFFLVGVLWISLIYSFLKKFFNGNRNGFILYTMLGYAQRDYFALEFFYLLYAGLLGFCLNSVLYFFGYGILNSSLTALFHTKINIFLPSSLSLCLIVLMHISALSAMYFIKYIGRNRKSLLTLLKRNEKTNYKNK